ncbi:MAG TPA: GGDEF domain-containing protein [Bacteriovoracaceae bacterium]|nr:GGDEF domain-containing protein [Bacteriovoracaceae bacterium]
MLFITQNLFAVEVCPLDLGVLPTITVTAVDATEKFCDKEFDDSYLDLATGCLSGGWKAGASLVDGLVEITKLLVIEAPQWIWEETKKKIDSLRKQDLSPFELVQAIANVQVASHSDIFNAAQEYWDTFLQFANNLKETLINEIKGFPCLPKFKQSEIICQGVTNVFLTLFTPGAFINGARWTVSTSRAVIKFAKESKKIHGLENADFATRLDRVTSTLKGGSISSEGIKVGNGVLKQLELPDGNVILQYSKQVVGNDGKSHTITREVPVDLKTKGIDANTGIGREILEGLVENQAGKGSLVFIDINHLGKVNYFAGGTQTGDKYLSSVSEALQKSLRPGDMIFKNGGDELVVVLNSNDSNVVKGISQRMIKEVDNHPQVRSLFRREVKDLSQQYKDLNKADQVDALPKSVRDRLSVNDIAEAHKDFDVFKTKQLERLKEDMMEQASYRGSISIGSALIRSEDTLSSTLTRAEAQASKVKAEYKQRLGHDIGKYNVTPEELTNIRKWSPPQALSPD